MPCIWGRFVHNSIMTDKTSSLSALSALPTEAMPHPEAWLDALDDAAALRLMLASQAEAAQAVSHAIPAIEMAARAMTAHLKANTTGRIIYAGAGTSARIGVQDGAELPPTFGWGQQRLAYMIAGGWQALLQAVEASEDNTKTALAEAKGLGICQADVVIGLSASGNTPYTLAALTAAQQAKAVTIGIANNPDTAVLSVATYPILLATGGEVVAGSTRLKAATAQKICLNMLSTLVMTRLGFVKHGLMRNLTPSNAKLNLRKQMIDSILAKTEAKKQGKA